MYFWRFEWGAVFLEELVLDWGNCYMYRIKLGLVRELSAAGVGLVQASESWYGTLVIISTGNYHSKLFAEDSSTPEVRWIPSSLAYKPRKKKTKRHSVTVCTDVRYAAASHASFIVSYVSLVPLPRVKKQYHHPATCFTWSSVCGGSSTNSGTTSSCRKPGTVPPPSSCSSSCSMPSASSSASSSDSSTSSGIS